MIELPLAAQRTLAARASTLHERLTPDFVPTRERVEAEAVEAKLRAWCEAAAAGDWQGFERRLAWDGLCLADARRAVHPAQLRDGAETPPWTKTLAAVLELARSDATPERCFDAGEPVPFEHVLAPFVAWARQAYEHRAGPALGAFSARARAGLERQLLELLSQRAARSLALELSIDRATASLVSGAEVDTIGDDEGYRAFSAALLEGGLLGFFSEYAVLARKLVSTAELWVEATLELVARFAQDEPALAELLGRRAPLTVESVSSGLSDPHARQRCVSILSLGDGGRIVYKPRPLVMEARWNELLRWLDERGAPVALRGFAVLDCGDHGWAEFVEHAACAGEDEARAYCTRYGALICLVHLLHGNDCHFENVVSAGGHPVLIDLETLACPRPNDSRPGGAQAPLLAERLLTHSVLATCLVPYWHAVPTTGQVLDLSPLGSERELDRARQVWRWQDVNTDRMEYSRGTRATGWYPHAVSSDGSSLRGYRYEDEVVSGFCATYRFLVRERAALLAPSSAFQRLRHGVVRFIFRPTSVYGSLHSGLTHPDVLRDGVDHATLVEQLAQATVVNARGRERCGWVEIFDAERRAVERGDVPFFCARTGGNDLIIAPGRQIAGWFPQSGHGAAAARLEAFSEDDLAFQVDVLRSALRSRRHPASPTPPSSSAAGACVPHDERTWLREAVALATATARAAIRGADGSAAWLDPVPTRELTLAGKNPFGPLGLDLYDGVVGVGLFLAAAARVSGLDEPRELAVAAVRPLLVELRERGEATADALGIGGTAGLGGAAYALTRMSELLDEPLLLEDARRAATLVTPARIELDRALDITHGSAGALLGLLALHGATREQVWLAAARSCGQRLTARLEDTGTGQRACRTLEGRFLTGFSHGAAGIAYALCRLHAVAPDPALRQTARELVAFERSTFSHAARDWPDLRSNDGESFGAAWCNGAPGIALARLGALEVIDDDEARREIERALEITARHGVAHADHLCCGAFGRVEILWTAGRVLGRPELCTHATEIAGQAVANAAQRGGYLLKVPSAGRFCARSLFLGTSGIGYTLLRLADPASVQELLLLR